MALPALVILGKMSRVMHLVLTMILSVSLLVMILPYVGFGGKNLAYACSCAAQPPEHYFSNAKVILSGLVTEISPDPSGTGYRITFDVSHVWKWDDQSNMTEPNGNVVMWTSSLGGGDCGFPFENGTEYLVYGSSSSVNGGYKPIEVGLCGGSKPLESSNTDIVYLTSGVSLGDWGPKTYDIVTDDGKRHPIVYHIIGGNITSITVDHATKSLIILLSPIVVPQTGEDRVERKLTLELPRDIIDAKVDHPKLGEMDVEYGIMVFEKGGMISYPFYELGPYSTPEERWIEIPFNETSDMIRVTGTSVIPEFSFTTSIFMATAMIVGIMALTTRKLFY